MNYEYFTVNLHYGGRWGGPLDYIGGEIERLSVPLGDQCYRSLIESVCETMHPITAGWIIMLHSLDADCPGGTVVKRKIKNNFDISCLLQKSVGRTPDLFATLKNMGNFVPGATQESQAVDDGGPYRRPEIPEENVAPAADCPRDWGTNGTREVDLDDDDGNVNIVLDVDGVVNDDAGIETMRVSEVKECVHAMLEEWSTWWGVRDDILNRSMSIFQRRRRNLLAHEPVSNTNWDNTNALTYAGRGWVIPGAPNVIADDPEDLFEVSPVEVGSTYMSKEDLLFAVGKFRLKNKSSYSVKYSDTTRYTIVCDNTNCPFQIAATASKGFWRVFSVRGHECAMDPRMNDYTRVPAKVVAAHFAHKLLEENSKLVPKTMISEFNSTYNMTISYDLALRAKHQAMMLMYGSEKTSFGMLPSYLYMLRKMIPGSVTGLEVDCENKFQSAFFALGPAIRGFKEYGLPVIVVDWTFLTGK